MENPGLVLGSGVPDNCQSELPDSKGCQIAGHRVVNLSPGIEGLELPDRNGIKEL